MIIDVACMFVGGIIGTLIRYGLIQGIRQVFTEYFDLATMITNYVGCLFAGILYVFSSGLKDWHKYIITTLSVGLCGSLTTFSGYAVHSLNGLKNDHVLSGLGEVLFSLIGCFLFLYIGILIGGLIKKLYLKHEIKTENETTDESAIDEL